MNPLLLVPFLLLSPLIGRENPFFPISDTRHVTSNIPDTKPPLDTLRYHLPDQARLLKEVTLTFQNLDGTIESRTI
ncbi:MAG: AMIN domain-containing protein, partial [Campylobacterales bacterium]|nr:AMIN domain-containing protein [Campylobacterales bacterium]